MKKFGPCQIQFFAAAGVILLTTVSLLGCGQSRETTPTTAATAAAAAPEKVFVIFEGPWAFAPDPKDAGKILAIAPKTKDHRDLYITPSKRLSLKSGVYDLSIPATTATGAPSIDPDITQAKTTAADLQRVLDNKAGRYAVRLPKPEAYVAAQRFHCRISSSYSFDTVPEKDCVTSVSLRYSVSGMSGFSLSGTPDSGSLNPELLRVETPTINFTIDPVQDDDSCNTHARQAFHDLTVLLKLTLYVDFPGNPNCHDKDPQKSKAALNTGSPDLRDRNLEPMQIATVAPEMASMFPHALSISAGRFSQRTVASIFAFFGRIPTDCMSPMLILTTS